MNSPYPAKKVIKAAHQSKLLNHMLTLCFIDSCKDTRPIEDQLTIGEIIESFSSPQINPKGLPLAVYLALDKEIPAQKKRRDAQKDGGAFIPVKFKRLGTRAAVDVERLYAYVLDFDGTADIDTIKIGLSDLCYIAYTSYSHSLDEERWRVIIFYNEPIVPELHLNVWQHFENIFPNMLDQRCKTLNQLWYCPACPHDAVNLFRFEFHEGELLDPTTLPAYVEVPADKTKVTTSANDFGSVIAALKYIDPEDRDIWIRVAMALKSEYGDDALDVWLEWSQRSDKYDEVDARYQWDSLKPRHDGVTIGTIYYLARQGGWISTNIDHANLASVEEVNQQHFISREGGKTIVFRETINPESGRVELQRLAPKDMKDFYANRRMSYYSGGKMKLTGLGDYWMCHPLRRQYEGVVFAPNTETPGMYNLWRGFAAEPEKGDWSLMQHHISNVLCSGIQLDYDYVIGWLANAVQHPERQSETALVLKGLQGTGKGVVARSFGQLFGQHFLHISQARHLTGNFNAHLTDCIVLFADEAFWAGDKQGEGVLKALITEPTITIEPKGVNAYSIPNRLHIIIASNNDWVVPAGPMERRYCVLNINDSVIQNHVYFDALNHEIKNGGQQAMLYDLMNYDLSCFNIRELPKTDGLRDQMIMSMPAEEIWWYEELKSGNIWKDANEYEENTYPKVKLTSSGSGASGELLFLKSALHSKFSNALVKGHPNRSTKTMLGIFLTKILPGGYPRHSEITRDGRTENYYALPSLEVARAYFEKVTGIVVELDGGAN